MERRSLVGTREFSDRSKWVVGTRFASLRQNVYATVVRSVIRFQVRQGLSRVAKTARSAVAASHAPIRGRLERDEAPLDSHDDRGDAVPGAELAHAVA
jgi:hypothetical protein